MYIGETKIGYYSPNKWPPFYGFTKVSEIVQNSKYVDRELAARNHFENRKQTIALF